MADRNRIIAQHAAVSALGGIKLAGMMSPKPPGFLEPMRTLGDYAAVYVFDGGGRFMDELGHDLPVTAGDLILLFPDIAHSYGTDADWSEFFLVFNGPVFDLWREQGVLDPDEPIVRLQPVDHWLRRFESVLGGSREAGWAPPLLEVCRLQEVLAEAIVGGSRGAVPQDDLNWAARACALLEGDLAPGADLAEVAEQMRTSYESFRKRFTKIVGMAPGKYRATRLIDRACELMQSTDMTDKQIALSLGFCDEFHFSRRFKQLIGRSPRAYRRTLPV